MNDRPMELLAPAGDMDALRAAVQNGADAVYLGAGRFNARQRAGNFDGDGLGQAVAYCHARGVKVHVTLNTLVRQDELDALYDTIRLINESGADAVIVQDFGVVNAVRQMAPALEVHASTQMAAHNVQAARFLKARGLDRVVLARECTWADMAACAQTGIDVEVFAHGALCVACSGQCLMSSMVGGRSGNRGLCAQPCRLPWRFGDKEGCLLSTRDLCAIDDLDALRRAGVTSLKIEGRLKRPEYVAVTVAAYRRALDAMYEGKDFDSRQERQALAQMFNRGGFTRGYGPGMREEDLMYPDRPNHIGVAVGECRQAGRVALKSDVLEADALVLRAKGHEDAPVRLSGAAGETVRCPQARPGDALIRLVSARQMDEAERTLIGERRTVSLTGHISLFVGSPARLSVSDGVHTVEALGDIVQPARNRGMDILYVKGQLSRTGGTPYAFETIAVEGDDNAFAPAAMLNALRRDALAELTAARTEVRRRTGRVEAPAIPKTAGAKPLLYAQASDPGMLRLALESGADVAVFSPRDLRPGEDGQIAADPTRLPERFALAVPAVLSEKALDALNAWATANRDRISETFVSNIGHLALEWPGRIIGDYLLNAASDLAALQLADWGVEAITPSIELTAGQIGAMGGEKHLIVWGRLPLMHLRTCPRRAALGLPGEHASCDHCRGDMDLGGQCLIDRTGAAFPLARLAMPGGCVVQVLNSVPLMPLRRLDRLPAAAGWRLLLRTDEPVRDIVRVYRAAIDGRDFKALEEWRTIEAMNTTTGHYFRGVE